jgi:hypothetical protein
MQCSAMHYLQKIYINIHIQFLMLDSEGGFIGFSFLSNSLMFHLVYETCILPKLLNGSTF